MMPCRTAILECFSTFIEFAEDRFETWISDPRLVKSMQRQLTQTSGEAPELEHQEGFWALYWHQRSQKHSLPMAKYHLWAYLQEPCYWAAVHVTGRFVTVHCTVADGFQMAIADLDRILKRYSPSLGSSLKSYARTVFGNTIRERLRDSHEIHICTQWGLLRRLGKRQLKKSLLLAGYTQTDSFILVWECFKAICIPEPKRSARRLPPPSQAQFAQMVERYNRWRHQYSPVPAALDAAALEKALEVAAKAARDFLVPPIISLNQADDMGKEPQDILSAPGDDMPMVQLLYAEQLQQIRQMEAVLEASIATLALEEMTLLQLNYRQGLTQEAIAAQLQIKQPKVAKKLKRIHEELLLSVAQWSQATLDISAKSTVLATASKVIKEWLRDHLGPATPEACK